MTLYNCFKYKTKKKFLQLINIFLKGRNVRFADNILLKAKLPPDTSRTLRPVVDRQYYKANEYRSIAFYVAFRMFRDILDQRHLILVIKYILFLRLLCQEVVSKEDVVTSQTLIKEFSHEYQVLFGRVSMTYNCMDIFICLCKSGDMDL